MFKYKIIILLILNIIFYTIYDVRYIPVIVIEILYSYYMYCNIKKNSNNKKLYLILGIVPIILTLAYFKYSGFFLKDIDGAIKIIMPLGISYYSFKIISFLADVYKEKITYNVSFLEYATYVSFFPQIVCGPISRTDEIIGQLKKDCKITQEKILIGFELIISGTFKKFVIAERLADYTKLIFENPTSYPALACWLAAFFFTIQIYCDFAGYSEIAIGICNLLGFKCKANFNIPYFSRSIKEFWNRWHISLSSWLRDYVYIPLGGNRCGEFRKNLNVLITFLVSGIWHGSGLSFICWGIYHGILNIIPVKKANKKWISCLQIVGTFLCVMFGWIIFNSSSLTNAMSFIINMFMNIEINYNIIVASVMPFTGDYSCLSYLCVVISFIIILSIYELMEYLGKIEGYKRRLYIRDCIYVMAIILFAIVGESNFLYANF